MPKRWVPTARRRGVCDPTDSGQVALARMYVVGLRGERTAVRSSTTHLGSRYMLLGARLAAELGTAQVSLHFMAHPRSTSQGLPPFMDVCACFILPR